jgi:GGDEF domain-containing protein
LAEFAFIERALARSFVMTFAHDGLRDSLTHLAAPPYFYENLRRDLATAERNKSRLTLIKFVLQSISEKTGNESHYEIAVLHFAELLKSSIRSEDLCARLGLLEFTLILKSSADVGVALAERILQGVSLEGFECNYSILEVSPKESSLEILNRLDNQELRSVTGS